MDDVFKNMPERDRDEILKLMGADPEEYKRNREDRERREKEIAEQKSREHAAELQKAFEELTAKRYKVRETKHFVFPKDLEPQESKEPPKVQRSWAQEKEAIELLEEQRRLRRTQQAAWEQSRMEPEPGQIGGAAYFAAQFKAEAEAYETALAIIREKRGPVWAAAATMQAHMIELNNLAVAYIENGPYENDMPGMEFAVKVNRISKKFCNLTLAWEDLVKKMGCNQHESQK